MASVIYSTPSTTSTYTVNVTGAGAGGFAGTGPSGSVTIPSSSYLYSTGAGTAWSTNITGNGNLTGSGLHVTSDAEFDGDIKWKGRDLGKLLEGIEKRLAILEPNPKKLEKFEALRKAYEHYKLLEALCHTDEDE